MFSGIIEKLGTLKKVESQGGNIIWTIAAPFASKLVVNESINHDGACLSVIKKNRSEYKVLLMAETIAKTHFARLNKGAILNLERSLKIGDRLSGHFVQGHVDTMLTITDIKKLHGSWKFTFSLPAKYKHLVVKKGSIAINGISLTISDLKKKKFSVNIIPYTFKHTNLQYLKIGDSVNVEFDIVGKYLSQWLAGDKI